MEQRAQQGLSILFTSHKMEEVMRICDRTIFLKEGKIIADDIPKKLAKSVSSFRVKLIISDGLQRTVSLVNRLGYKYSLDHRSMEIMIEEEKIPAFLDALSKASVSYANIKIEEPSLEDFFLQTVKNI